MASLMRRNGLRVNGPKRDEQEQVRILRWLLGEQETDYRRELERWGGESAASYLDPERGHYTLPAVRKGTDITGQDRRLLRLLSELATKGAVVLTASEQRVDDSKTYRWGRDTRYSSRVETRYLVGVGPRLMPRLRRAVGAPRRNGAQAVERVADGARFFDLSKVPWDSLSNHKSRETVVILDPEVFLRMAAPTEPSADKLAGVRDAVDAGTLLSDVPYLTIGPADDRGVAKVTGHEGRHRAMTLMEEGVTRMPVRLMSDNFRWGVAPGGFNGNRPTELEQEDGEELCRCGPRGRMRRVPVERYETISTPRSVLHADPDETAAAVELLDTLFRPNKSAQRTDPELWGRVKAEVTRGTRGGKRGQWSARKAQLAVKLYKDRGGGYVGPKDPDNSLTRWTEQDWRTKSGQPSLETGERYLPAKAIEALTDAEYAATSRAKRRGMRRGEQFTDQPDEIAKKTSRYRRNAKKQFFRGAQLVWEDFAQNPNVNERLLRLVVDGEQRGFLRVKRDLDMPELAETAGCPEDLKRLYAKRARRFTDGIVPVWQTWVTEIDHQWRNKGYGKELYREAMFRIGEEMKDAGYAGFFFVPSFCGSRDRSGTTTEAAKRVWRSLTREFRSRSKEGLIIYVVT